MLHINTSQVGLGAILLQDSMPVTYVSKTLTPAMTKYATTEINAQCHIWVLGSTTIICMVVWQEVCVNHQPLENIQNLSDTPPRWQRLLLMAQSHDFQIKYIPVKKEALADIVSSQNS